MNKTQQSRAVVLAVGAVAIMIYGTQAYADPIRFDNPPGAGHFDWRPQVTGDQIYLNIVADAASQTPGSGASGSFRHRAQDPAGTNIRRAGPFGEGPEFAYAPSGNAKLVIGVDEGAEIPSTAADGFSSGGYVFNAGPEPGDPATLLTAGVETYLGVRFGEVDDTGVFQYGWIGVVPEWRTFEIGGVPTDTLVLDTFAWGYETTPGVPIAAGVPEPGSLALLAFGALAAAGRRRRA